MSDPSPERPQLRLLVIGASGRTGRPLVSLARARGHDVTVLIRRAGQDFEPGVKVVEGDPTEEADVRAALSNVDLIVSCLGQSGGASPHLLRSAAIAVTGACDGATGFRYIVVSQGLLFPTRNPAIHLLRYFLRRVTQDSRDMERIVTVSKLDWTIVRPPRLVSGEPRRTPVAEEGQRPRGRLAMRRSELARFLIDEAEQGKFQRKVVGVASR